MENTMPHLFKHRALDRSNLSFFIGGLAVCGLHKGIWQSAILENVKNKEETRPHKLELSVWVSYGDGFVKLNSPELPPHVKGFRDVSFTVENQISPTGLFYPAPTDSRYIEHIADFSKLHKGKVPFKLPAANRPNLTRVAIPGGTAYSALFAGGDENPDKFVFSNAPEDDPGRFLGSWIGMDLECETPSDLIIIVSVPGVSGITEVPYKIPSNGRLVVVLDNLCEACSEEIDFEYYYTSNGGIVATEKPISLVRHGPKILNRVACNVMLATMVEDDAGIFGALG